VLQSIDLAHSDPDAVVAAQCEAEGIPERSLDVGSLVRAALSSESVKRAAGRPHWREVYFCAPVGPTLLEGYVDLLYRDDDGLVVVDYKTASTSDPTELARRVTIYRHQGAAYAAGVADTAGEAVARVVFVFLTPAGAVEYDLPGLKGEVETVRNLVTVGRDLSPA
jgi:ATP-dependent helicase/nuclease subunit A